MEIHSFFYNTTQSEDVQGYVKRQWLDFNQCKHDFHSVITSSTMYHWSLAASDSQMKWETWCLNYGYITPYTPYSNAQWANVLFLYKRLLMKYNLFNSSSKYTDISDSKIR